MGACVEMSGRVSLFTDGGLASGQKDGDSFYAVRVGHFFISRLRCSAYLPSYRARWSPNPSLPVVLLFIFLICAAASGIVLFAGISMVQLKRYDLAIVGSI
jgi:hypothetical protein